MTPRSWQWIRQVVAPCNVASSRGFWWDLLKTAKWRIFQFSRWRSCTNNLSIVYQVQHITSGILYTSSQVSSLRRCHHEARKRQGCRHRQLVYITRSHGSVTSVVRATRQVNGRRQLTPLTTPTTPLNRQSRNIAHVITSTISPHKPHLVKIASSVTSTHIATVTTQFFLFISFFVRKIFLSTWSSGRWTDFDTRYTIRRVFTQGSASWDQTTIFSHLHPQNPKYPILGHI